MLSPILPHVCHVLWQNLGNVTPVYQQQWPSVDVNALKSDTIELVVQVNGKKRATISVSNNAENKEIEDAAQNNENVKRFIEKMKVVKIIIVPKRLVNIVAK